MSKIGKHLQLRGLAHYCAPRKNLESRTQLDEPIECTSGSNPLLLYKILHLLFFPLVWILCALRLERQNYQHGLDAGPLEFQCLRLRGRLTNPFRTLLLCFGVIGKTLVLISCNNFVKKFLSALAIAIMSWQDVTHLPFAQGQGVWNKMCTQISLSQILFQNPKNYSLRDVQRFCYHSWCDSMVIFYQISNSSNVSLSSSWFWTATSLFIFYQLPSISESRISPKNFWSAQSRIPISLLHQCFCHRWTSFETKFYANSLFISANHDI